MRHAAVTAARRLSALALLVLPLTAASCGADAREDAAPLDVALELDPSPPRTGPVRVTVALRSGDAPLAGAEVRLEGNMNHAGMVPELATAEETEPGRYAADMEFTMGGDWFFVVTATGPDGQTVERVVEVPGVSAGGGGSQ